jgi:hypothetical protein
MSAEPAVTMQDLELEHAELLPGRETLCSPGHHHPGGGGGSSQEGYGNTVQTGIVNVSVANGSFNNVVSVGSGTVG